MYESTEDEDVANVFSMYLMSQGKATFEDTARDVDQILIEKRRID